jgi:nitrate/nitrite transporter NarK
MPHQIVKYQTRARLNRAAILTALVAAGEGIFILPFTIPRIFRPAFLDVFGLTNLQLGTAFSLYGAVAMLAYFSGGPLADCYPARRLMTAALVATALGGIVLAAVPPAGTLTLLYGFWGLSTILLFWGALIRATREWGGAASQGRAFGLLEGGRGLVAALLASLAVSIFAALLPTGTAAAPGERAAALVLVIWIFSGIMLGIAVLVWFLVPETGPGGDSGSEQKFTLEGACRVVRMPALWLQATIVTCAYVGYKSLDDFSLFARDAFGYGDVAAGSISALSFWVRPFAAVGAGLLADRINASRVTAVSFAIVMAGSLAAAFGLLQPGYRWMLVATIGATSAGVSALRGVYFALFEEALVPLAFTGSAAGIVSVIGYTPDVFIGPLMGFLLDRSPGPLGHQHFFGAVAAFAAVGLIATLLFMRVKRVLVRRQAKISRPAATGP